MFGFFIKLYPKIRLILIDICCLEPFKRQRYYLPYNKRLHWKNLRVCNFIAVDMICSHFKWFGNNFFHKHPTLFYFYTLKITPNSNRIFFLILFFYLKNRNKRSLPLKFTKIQLLIRIVLHEHSLLVLTTSLIIPLFRE